MGRYELSTCWKSHAGDDENEDTLALFWSVPTLEQNIYNLSEQIEIQLERDEDRATRVEIAAVVVSIAIMSHIQPESRLTGRSRTGTRHDYYLNDSRDEMIEIAGRWQAGIPGLLEEKKLQSERNPRLKDRWVSVTVFHASPRNRTEGLHA